MEIKLRSCSACGGPGKSIEYKITSMTSKGGTATRTEVECPQCKGRGYTNYAEFSVEEAEAILKFCKLIPEE